MNKMLGNKKYILKDILYDYVPKKMMDRPKNGFGVPLGKWLRTFLKDEINRVSQKDYLDKQGIFNYEAVQELISKVDKSDKKPYPKMGFTPDASSNVVCKIYRELEK